MVDWNDSTRRALQRGATAIRQRPRFGVGWAWRTHRMGRTGDFPETRMSLLATVRGGEGAAWREFFAWYGPPIFHVARRRGLAAHDAEDIVQQVMISVAGHIERFDYNADRGQFRQWVRTIAENKIRDHLRRSGGDALLTPAVEDTPAETIEESWEAEWRLQDTLWCLDELAADIAPRRLEAFRLYVLEGASAEEVAAQLQISIGNVYVIRTQVLNRIRAKLRDLGYEGRV